jgi:raffinose synthase
MKESGGGEQQAQTPGLKLLVEEAKREHGVRYVYVCHAMAGTGAA